MKKCIWNTFSRYCVQLLVFVMLLNNSCSSAIDTAISITPTYTVIVTTTFNSLVKECASGNAFRWESFSDGIIGSTVNWNDWIIRSEEERYGELIIWVSKWNNQDNGNGDWSGHHVQLYLPEDSVYRDKFRIDQKIDFSGVIKEADCSGGVNVKLDTDSIQPNKPSTSIHQVQSYDEIVNHFNNHIANKHFLQANIDWTEYVVGLIGTKVHWSGYITGIGKYGTICLVDTPGIGGRDYCLDGLPDETLLTLDRGQKVEFTASIKDISDYKPASNGIISVYLDKPSSFLSIDE